MDWIDYRDLHKLTQGYSNLFLDYLLDFESVREFYTHNFRDPKAAPGAMKAIDGRNIDRLTLAEVLSRQNHDFGSGTRALENIALLRKPRTYAIVTGQQVGLFGGPMYTLLKTVTVLKLVDQMKAKYPSADFVPVFWLEGEDHDFGEMNNASVFDTKNDLCKLEYFPEGEKPERNLGPIGELVFDDSLLAVTDHLGSLLQQSEFTPDLLSKLRECYRPGRTFIQAFVEWMNFLFGNSGLVFISSNTPEFKRLLSPLFVREIAEYPRNSQMVIARSAELEKNYHAQIKPKSMNLFKFHKGGRYLIFPREDDLSLKGTRHFLTKEELLRIAEEHPEELSPNVVLRPLAQDTLLPTLAYVAGPSELAYHAQLQPLYDYLNIPQPIIYPRLSCSFVDERLRRAMEKYDLELTEFLGDVGKVSAKVAEQISSVKLDQLFASAQERTEDILNELKFGLNEIDPTLLGVLDTTRSKIEKNFESLHNKSIAAQKRRYESAVRQVEKAAAGLLPNRSLQEREVNIIYYMNKYGPETVFKLLDKLEISIFKHQILTI